ncbi:MAG: class I SAM-dependent methyltransferase [Chloroflexota bacterium]
MASWLMRLGDLRFLLSQVGRELLEQTAATPLTPDNHLPIAGRLRQQVGPTQAQAILETVLLRQLAVTKFGRAAEMFFTRPALEQASAEGVSHYRAGRFQAAGWQWIADLGCGIGGDSLALAAQAQVIGIELDEVRLRMAGENARVYGRGERFYPLCADLRQLAPLPIQALFFDPARRDEHGRRLYSVQHYRPPLTLLDAWREKTPNAAAKISPGVDYDELPPAAEVEFISVAGGVREAVLWFGDLRSAAQRRATLLPAGHTLTDQDERSAAVARPQSYLYEPDGAVIRAHLVEQLAYQLEAARIDPQIAYLTAGHHQPTPFATVYAIEDAFPFQLKRLRTYLRQRNVGRVVVKKRGSPLDPDWLRHQLRLGGDEERVIFLTQVQGAATVLVGRAG